VSLAVESIRRFWNGQATAGVILGSGLGELAEGVKRQVSIPYDQIVGFPRCSALAHLGRLVCGDWNGAAVIVMQGRCHVYEGYPLEELGLPVRALAVLGVTKLVVTNASGGMNPNFCMGDVMVIEDQINLMGRRVREESGVRSQGTGNGELLVRARSHVPLYDRELAAEAEWVARRGNFALRRGVYVGVTGPSYETRAEYRAFRRIGGDCVGMSTVPEVLAAADCGLRVLGLSIITNIACPDAPKRVTADEVVEVAGQALPKVKAIVEGVVVRSS
jgi:purine-nucleoside phosphorylase